MSFGTTVDETLDAVLARPLHSLCLLNITASLGGVVLLAGLDRGQFGAGGIAMLSVMLLLFAGVSALWVLPDLPDVAVRAQVLAALGVVTAVTGLKIPVATDMGAAFPAVFLMAGAMLVFAWAMRALCTTRGDSRMTAAWDIMGFAMVFLPLVTAVSAAGMLLVGWPITAAAPAGGLTAVLVNPLVGYAVIIHGPPHHWFR